MFKGDKKKEEKKGEKIKEIFKIVVTPWTAKLLKVTLSPLARESRL